MSHSDAILVTPAQPHHFTAIQQIYAYHVLYGLASFETTPPDSAELLARYQKAQESGLPWWVALADGHVLGYCYLAPYRPRAAYRYTVEDSVYVHHEAAGRGVGKQLLATAIAWAEQQGYRQMVANIGNSENHASLGLHRSQGFCIAGTLRAVGLKHGRWLDTVLMQRELGTADRTLPE